MSRARKEPAPDDAIPIKRYVIMTFYCENCKQEISSYANDKGEQHVTCPRCGAEYHRKRISRRRVEIVMKAARGNYFDWDDAI